jgi:hypothetical protein
MDVEVPRSTRLAVQHASKSTLPAPSLILSPTLRFGFHRVFLYGDATDLSSRNEMFLACFSASFGFCIRSYGLPRCLGRCCHRQRRDTISQYTIALKRSASAMAENLLVSYLNHISFSLTNTLLVACSQRVASAARTSSRTHQRS